MALQSGRDGRALVSELQYAVGDLVFPVPEVVGLLAPNSHEFGYGHF